MCVRRLHGSVFAAAAALHLFEYNIHSDKCTLNIVSISVAAAAAAAVVVFNNSTSFSLPLSES